MINFPTSLDSLPNPTGVDLLENATLGLDHDQQHSNANDAIEALEAKVGINSSAVTTSHDYKLSAVTGSAKALTSGTSTQSVTGLTLVSPTLSLTSDATGDIYYRNSGGALTRLPIGTTGQILDVSVSGIPEWIPNPSAADASYTVKGVSYVDADVKYYAADAGSNDTYAITLSPAPNAYVTGQTFTFKANTVNTGAATLNVNGLGAKTIVKGVNTTLADADIAANQLCHVKYDGTNFVLLNPNSPAVASLPAMVSMVVNIPTSSTSVTVTHNLGVIPRYAYFRSSNFKVSTGTAVGTGYATWNNSTGVLVRQNYTGYNLDTNGGVVSFTNTASAVANVSGSGNGCAASVGNTTSSSFTLTFGASASGTSTDFYIEIYA